MISKNEHPQETGGRHRTFTGARLTDGKAEKKKNGRHGRGQARKKKKRRGVIVGCAEVEGGVVGGGVVRERGVCAYVRACVRARACVCLLCARVHTCVYVCEMEGQDEGRGVCAIYSRASFRPATTTPCSTHMGPFPPVVHAESCMGPIERTARLGPMVARCQVASVNVRSCVRTR